MSEVLKYKGYIGSVEFSIDDNCLYGKVEYINDLIMFDGETVGALKKSFEEAVDSYLSFCKERGVSPDQPFKGSLNVRLGERLHKEASIKAREQCVSLNEFIKSAVEDKLCDKSQVIHRHEHSIIFKHKTESIEYNLMDQINHYHDHEYSVGVH